MNAPVESMHSNPARALHGLLMLVTLTACSAAPPPCLVARPGIRGYGVLLVRNGPAPDGCTDLPVTAFGFDAKGNPVVTPLPARGSPALFFDGWRTDLYKSKPDISSADELAIHSDLMALPKDASTVVRTAWPATPDSQQLCTVKDVPAMTDKTADPLGIGGTETELTYKISTMTFLDGAKYAGLQFTADVEATFGTCTSSYTASGLAPSVYEGFLNGNANNCSSDADCDPNADVSAGRVGSGYNPDFKVVCRKDIGAAFVNPDGSGVCFAPDGATFPFLK
jgi:hypothetical protein